MRDPRHIAVIDVGKTNAKLAVVDAVTLAEIAVVTRSNAVLPGPPWPHFDLEGHWAFFLDHLEAFHRTHGIDAISVTTHGAAAVLLDGEGHPAVPMLDYEHPGPDALANRYEAIRPPFEETGSARLPMGLNLGAQIHWLFETHPDLAARVAHIVTYPQYWGYRLTGRFATDVTSLGCHTDLWEPWTGKFSSLAYRLGIESKLAPALRSGDVLGTLLPQIARQTGLDPQTPVTCGIHDSNASLYPYVVGRTSPFAVVSTGTWVVCMAMDGDTVELDARRDVLVNVNALGQPVPSARFMGGREYEIIRAGETGQPDDADRACVLEKTIALLPAIEPGSGPFAGREAGWIGKPRNAGERLVALSYYLALMTDTCLGLIGARGPAIVEGPFARNRDYLDMLAAIRPEGAETATSATGTSIGAALLCLKKAPPPETFAVPLPVNALALQRYAEHWQQALRTERPV